jgi:excisionase family DNA binding protein
MSASRIGRSPDPEQQRSSAEAVAREAAAAFVDALVTLALTGAPQQPRPPVELLSAEEFAHRAGVARSTLWALLNRGEIGSTKLGGRRLIPTTELERLADAATRRSAGADR